MPVVAHIAAVVALAIITTWVLIVRIVVVAVARAAVTLCVTAPRWLCWRNIGV